ncbi:MAG: signal recognition particle receptor subunit alpha, partial [Phreatobacter sp.]|nr:signal recognition particle receptor subunit alpha [Phreatobacter sp.]
MSDQPKPDEPKRPGFFKRLFGQDEPAPPQPAPPAVPAPTVPAEPRSWWRRLTEGLSRTSSKLGAGVTDLFTKRKLDHATLEELEDLLIQADLGVETAGRIAGALAKGRFGKDIAPEEVRAVLAGEIEAVLAPVARPLVIDTAARPFVIMVVGVNGAGKTTTIGKLAAKFRAEGRSVMLGAGDTFRAAAIEQ